MSPELCVGCIVGVAYEMPISDVNRINPKSIDGIDLTKGLRPHTLPGVYYVNPVYTRPRYC